MTHIHAVKLMLPNTPEIAVVMDGGCLVAAIAAEMTKEAMGAVLSA